MPINNYEESEEPTLILSRREDIPIRPKPTPLAGGLTKPKQKSFDTAKLLKQYNLLKDSSGLEQKENEFISYENDKKLSESLMKFLEECIHLRKQSTDAQIISEKTANFIAKLQGKHEDGSRKKRSKKTLLIDAIEESQNIQTPRTPRTRTSIFSSKSEPTTPFTKPKFTCRENRIHDSETSDTSENGDKKDDFIDLIIRPSKSQQVTNDAETEHKTTEVPRERKISIIEQDSQIFEEKRKKIELKFEKFIRNAKMRKLEENLVKKTMLQKEERDNKWLKSSKKKHKKKSKTKKKNEKMIVRSKSVSSTRRNKTENSGDTLSQTVADHSTNSTKKNKSKKYSSFILIKGDKDKPKRKSLNKSLELGNNLKISKIVHKNEPKQEIKTVIDEIENLHEELKHDDTPISKQRVLLQIYYHTEEPSNHEKIINYESFIETLKKHLLSDDLTIRLVTCKIFSNLASEESNRIKLYKIGVLQVLISMISKLMNIEDFLNGTVAPTKDEFKLVKEGYKLLDDFCKLKDVKISLVHSKGFECIIDAIKYDLLKIQQLGIKCLNTLIAGDENIDIVPQKLLKKGILASLYSLVKNERIPIQREVLKILHYLTRQEVSRQEIFKKGIFHSFLWLMRSQDLEIQRLSVESIANFVTNGDNIRVDALVLKYGLDAIMESFLSPNSHYDLLVPIYQCISHLSEYKRIHSVLLQKHVLKKIFSLTLDESEHVTALTFSSLLILSNLSKFKDGQQEIYRNGGLEVILSSLRAILALPSETLKKVGPVAHYSLLPKVVTRVIANMSAENAECQEKIVSQGILDPLVELVMNSSERTVSWNGLCVIANLCDLEQNQKKILRKVNIKQCLQRFLNQTEDVKLQSRALRCISVLSSNVKLQPLIIESFNIKTIVQLASNVNKDDVLYDALKFISNLCQNDSFHSVIVSSGGIGLIVKLSFFPIPQFQLEIAKGLYYLAMNAKCRPLLFHYGAVTRLLAMKEIKNEKIRKYCTSALLYCTVNS